MLPLFHRTNKAASLKIFAEGFRDDHGTDQLRAEHCGVWLSDTPLDANAGACGEVLFLVKLEATEDEIAKFEWREEGKPYREWFIPANFVNSRATLEVEDDETVDILTWV